MARYLIYFAPITALHPIPIEFSNNTRSIWTKSQANWNIETILNGLQVKWNSICAYSSECSLRSFIPTKFPHHPRPTTIQSHFAFLLVIPKNCIFANAIVCSIPQLNCAKITYKPNNRALSVCSQFTSTPIQSVSRRINGMWFSHLICFRY